MKKLNYKHFQSMMFITLAVVGTLQFFEHPKILDYSLGVLALIFGILSIHKKYKDRR